MTGKRLALDVDYLIREYTGGRSEYSIAAELNVSRNVIRIRLRENGVEIRGCSSAGIVRAARMTPAERARQASAAHLAATGRVKTHEEKCMAARTRQDRMACSSPGEILLAKLLRDRGVEVIQQLAIGPYNCDLACGSVAVEVFGGYWHRHGYHARTDPERFRYILNSGWNILVVQVGKGFPITDAVADYVASYVNISSSYPAVRREYRVIRGAGELIAAGSLDDDQISLEPAFTAGRNAIGQYTRVPR